MVCAAFVLLLLSSCGYHFTPVGGVVPENAKTIAIPVFINDSLEPYADVEVTKAVVEAFLTDARLQVVSPESADLILRGRITKFTLTPLSYTTDAYVQQYQIGISVDVSVEDARSKKILWQEAGLNTIFSSYYSVTMGDITTTKIARETALKSACSDIASTIRSRVLEGF